MATVIAGPGISRHLADFGADVIKVEPPGGDPVRRMGWKATPDDDALYWKLLSRGKRCRTLNLKDPAGRGRLLELVDDAHVLIENLRPGKLEALGLAPAVLHERNPALVVVRVTGFGQDGPYANRPGFATNAEAMGGWAAISGEPDGKPQLPPVALTDEVTAMSGAFATMVALWHARETGEGQVVDCSLLDNLLQLLGPLPAANAALGYEQPRLGGGIPYTSPRGTYRTADGEWIAVSTSSEAIATRVLGLLGVADDERFSTQAGRLAHRDELDVVMDEWVAQRTMTQVVRALDAIDAAYAPVNSMSQILADPHVQARQSLIEVDGVVMQNAVARMSRTPPVIRHAGAAPDSDRGGGFTD